MLEPLGHDLHQLSEASAEVSPVAQLAVPVAELRQLARQLLGLAHVHRSDSAWATLRDTSATPLAQARRR